ncbi:MAG: HAMP domain-containing histidine kinase [Chloroflexota bacterium]
MNTDRFSDTSSLKPKELQAMYAISKVVADSLDVDEALDEITKITREVFIFDSAVIYHVQEKDLMPVFARLIGRGQSAPTNLMWGDMAAQTVIESGESFFQHEEVIGTEDRLDHEFYLSLPMMVSGSIIGAMVFIRFGGPEYNSDQINLAEFIVAHVSQLFQHQRLIEKIGNLEAEKRLAQLQDNFIAMVSHELNTPLGFIKGYTTTLLRQDAEWTAENREEFLGIIDEETDRLAELIENLLDSSRLQSEILDINLLPIKLGELGESLQSHLASRFGAARKLEFKISPSNASVMVDQKRLAQVLENMVSNAMKYAKNSPIQLTFSSGSDYAVIMVGDQGPGIPQEHIANIFDRFYRVPEQSAGVRGTGLGLFICKKIIEAHNGDIQVESEVNQETVFKIYLPLISKKD